MTLNELAYELAGMLGKDDQPETVERLKLTILKTRDLLIRRDYERATALPVQLLQHLLLPLVDLEGYSLPGRGLKATPEIPTLISLKGLSDFTYVGTPGFQSPYGVSTLATIDAGSASRWTGMQSRFAYALDRVFVQYPQQDQLLIQGCFLDPREVMYRQGIPDADDQPFPLTGALAERITQSIMSAELRAAGEEAQTVTMNG